jgi:hypothetical protein
MMSLACYDMVWGVSVRPTHCNIVHGALVLLADQTTGLA